VAEQWGALPKKADAISTELKDLIVKTQEAQNDRNNSSYE